MSPTHPKKDRRVRKKIHESSDIHVGKQGITQGVVEEIKRRLKREGVLKIRMNKGLFKATGKDRRELAQEIAEKTGSELVEVRGNTLILRRRESPQ